MTDSTRAGNYKPTTDVLVDTTYTPTSPTVSDNSPDLFNSLDIQGYVVLALTVTVLTVGVTSWIKFKKIRTLKNYVFLNIIFATILSYITLAFDAYGYFQFIKISGLTLTSLVIIYDSTISYFMLVIHFWLLVLCCIFYVDIVKVFSADISRRYLKSSLFAWGVPVFVTIVFSVALPITFLSVSKYFSKGTNAKILNVFFYMSMSIYFIPLTMNACIYIKVLVTLFKTTSVSKTGVKSRRYYIATLIFLLSGTLSLTVPIFAIVETPIIIKTFVDYSQIVALDVYFLVVKSNRMIWQEFYINQLRKKTAI